MKGQTANLVELGVHPLGDDFSLPDGHGGLVHEFFVETCQQGGAWIQRLQERQERVLSGRAIGDGLDCVQPTPHLPQFPRIDAS